MDGDPEHGGYIDNVMLGSASTLDPQEECLNGSFERLDHSVLAGKEGGELPDCWTPLFPRMGW